MGKIHYIKDLDSLTHLSSEEKLALRPVTEQHAFRSNDYYLSLIDWNNPDCPIRRIAIPNLQELHPYGANDPSDEATNYVAPGTQHKYPHTVLLLVAENCATYCRFCFRKRIFQWQNSEIRPNTEPGLDYIRQHPEVNNVLLTGGDPLTLSTRRLEKIIRQLRDMPHVDIIRLGTKILAFNPFRILNDLSLTQMLSRYSTNEKRIYFMVHFSCIQELTEPALEAIDTLHRAGVVLANQTPLLRGINNDPEQLAELMHRLSSAGVTPYYFFQCRPAKGNWPFSLTIVEAHRLMENAKRQVCGLAKRAHLVMSHTSGKIEIAGVDRRHIYLRYHRARNAADEGRFMVFQRDDRAIWFDDLVSADRQSQGIRKLQREDRHFYGLE